ncbi:MAG TPA: response regulator transcription factor [Chthonomonadaceae bacterium]|nr:response regulator transcription factor [Chthonomonadaceae bacterium]
MTAAKKIKLLLVDDHPIVREGLRAMLERQADMEVIAEARDGLEAVRNYRTYRPDVAIVDFVMPRMNGIEALKAIRTESPDAKVLIFSNYDGEEDVYQAIQAGAFGYILKEAPRDEVLEAIRGAHAGHRSISGTAARRLSQRLSKPQLSTRERDVLALIVEGRTNQEIGTALYISEGTVKSHVNSILSKLSASDRTQAAIYAVRSGLIHL